MENPNKQVANLMMHVPVEKLDNILKVLPKLKSPTIKKMAGADWYDVSTSCGVEESRELIPQLKRLGCEGIVQWPVMKLVP